MLAVLAADSFVFGRSQVEEVTATELAWISQLVDALDRSWEAYHSESSISKLWQRLTPTRSPTEQHDGDPVQAAVESAETPAHPHAEPAVKPLQETRGELDPRTALAAARAALAAAEAEAEAIDWGRHKVSVRPSHRRVCVRSPSFKHAAAGRACSWQLLLSLSRWSLGARGQWRTTVEWARNGLRCGRAWLQQLGVCRLCSRALAHGAGSNEVALQQPESGGIAAA